MKKIDAEQHWWHVVTYELWLGACRRGSFIGTPVTSTHPTSEPDRYDRSDLYTRPNWDLP